MPELSQLLTAEQRAAYARFGELMDPASAEAFVRQLSYIAIAREDVAHTTFGIVEDLQDFVDAASFKYALDCFYDDVDGVAVDMILHFVDPGVVSWAERFRYDDKPVTKAFPKTEDIRFTIDAR